jgi:hypothetical protein
MDHDTESLLHHSPPPNNFPICFVAVTTLIVMNSISIVILVIYQSTAN